jgi:hypothetical protein
MKLFAIAILAGQMMMRRAALIIAGRPAHNQP